MFFLSRCCHLQVSFAWCLLTRAGVKWGCSFGWCLPGQASCARLGEWALLHESELEAAYLPLLGHPHSTGQQAVLGGTWKIGGSLLPLEDWYTNTMSCTYCPLSDRWIEDNNGVDLTIFQRSFLQPKQLSPYEKSVKWEKGFMSCKVWSFAG